MLDKTWIHSSLETEQRNSQVCQPFSKIKTREERLEHSSSRARTATSRSWEIYFCISRWEQPNESGGSEAQSFGRRCQLGGSRGSVAPILSAHWHRSKSSCGQIKCVIHSDQLSGVISCVVFGERRCFYRLLVKYVIRRNVGRLKRSFVPETFPSATGSIRSVGRNSGKRATTEF